MHPSADPTPVAPEYLPAAQLLQTDEAVADVPVAVLNLPAAHWVHDAAAVPLYVPAVQSEHADAAAAPRVALAFPATHDLQVDSAVAPSSTEYLPVPHRAHAPREDAPAEGPYRPAEHFLQVVDAVWDVSVL